MRPWRFTEEQIIAILAEQERGAPTAEVCRRHRTTSTTLGKWKSKFGGMGGEPLSAIGPRTMAIDVRRPKDLEGENAKLEELLAEQILEQS